MALVVIYTTTYIQPYLYNLNWDILTSYNIILISKISKYVAYTALWGVLEHYFDLWEINFTLGQFLWGASYSKAILGKNSHDLQSDNQIKHNKFPALFMDGNVNPERGQDNSESDSRSTNYNLTFGWDDRVFKISTNGVNNYYSYNEIKIGRNQRVYNQRHGINSPIEITRMSRMYLVITNNTSATSRTRFTSETIDFINERFIITETNVRDR